MLLTEYLQYVLYCNLHLCGRNWRSWPCSGGLQSANSQPARQPHLLSTGLRKASKWLQQVFLSLHLPAAAATADTDPADSHTHQD